MTKPTEVDDSNFAQVVLKAEKPVLVDFWAPWCGPCLRVGPIVEELASEFGDKVDFAKVNVDNNRAIASQYSIRSIPTLILFNKGKPVQHMVGFRPKAELKQQIETALT